jgi:hypothetical protein
MKKIRVVIDDGIECKEIITNSVVLLTPEKAVINLRCDENEHLTMTSELLYYYREFVKMFAERSEMPDNIVEQMVECHLRCIDSENNENN